MQSGKDIKSKNARSAAAATSASDSPDTRTPSTSATAAGEVLTEARQRNSQPEPKRYSARKDGEGVEPCNGGGCSFTFDIRSTGDIHIHNYCAPPHEPPTPGGMGGDDCLPCSTGGSCLPPVAGTKHKLSRAQKLALRAASSRVPSVLASSTLHAIRRHVAGHASANAFEQMLFTKLDKLPASLLRCIIDGVDDMPAGQRGPLVTPDAFGDPSQPLDPDRLAESLLDEIVQRAGLNLFGDPAAAAGERPGQERLYVPVGEDFFQQVRICRVNQLRTANYIPILQPQEYLPEEIQHACEVVIVDGAPQVVCPVQSTDCPGHPVAGVCGRVLDISQGESVELEGVNYFDVNAKVRLVDKETGTISRDVDAFIWGDLDTPREETINNETRLVNDCRVHDKATFTVPSDIPPGIYTVQVVVPNSVNNPGFGSEIISNAEYINVLPPPNARYEIAVERIIARKETSPASWGSDEVGLRTIACAMNLAAEPLDVQITKFADLDGVEFDSGTARNLQRLIFSSDQPILALVIGVLGHEIDDDDAYSEQINDWQDVFVDLVKSQWQFLLSLISAGGGLSQFKAIGWKGVIVAAAIAVITIAIDFIYALWAPADLIIEDTINLSVIDLDRLTSAAAPVPPGMSFRSNGGILVNVNKTIPPEKLPFQYRETREYVSDEEDSRYELTYRYTRVT